MVVASDNETEKKGRAKPPGRKGEKLSDLKTLRIAGKEQNGGATPTYETQKIYQLKMAHEKRLHPSGSS